MELERASILSPKNEPFSKLEKESASTHELAKLNAPGRPTNFPHARVANDEVLQTLHLRLHVPYL